MIAYSAVQAHATALIAAASAWAKPGGFTDDIVLADDGKQAAAEEKALREVGYACSVFKPLEGRTRSQGGSLANIVVGLGVRVAMNPNFEVPEARVSTYPTFEALVTATKDALLSYNGGTVNTANNRYAMAEQAFILDASSPGELAVILFFEKQCTF
jgi:hypothetical protein